MFVFYDTTQYTKGDYRNRNKIKGANRAVQLTLPVSFQLGQNINEVSFDCRALKKHFQTITQSYSKAPFFQENKELLEDIYSYEGNNLSEFCIHMIQKICESLEIKTKFITLSEETGFVLQNSSTQALVDICKYFEADAYVVWWDAWYMDNDLFWQNNITLKEQNFKHPEYTQLWWDFESYMSVIDLILNVWTVKAREIIYSSSI